MTENNRLAMMKRNSAVFVMFLSVVCSFALESSDFHLINLLKNYTDAKSYCREMYTDLATIYNSEDMNNLITLVSSVTARAWIGLEIGDVWMWHWSWPNQRTDFFNWKPGEPKENNQEECAAMDQYGGWFISDCGTRRNFICRGSDNTSNFIFVAEAKSWRDAQSHCRGLSTDLVSIQSEEENTLVYNVSASQDVWIGLFKDPWKWSDGSNSSFRYWNSSQPSYRENQNCVAAVFQAEGLWNDQKCHVLLYFVCRGARKSSPVPTFQNSTLQLPTNLTGTVSINFTVAPTTKQSNTTNVTTTARTTESGLTTPNTTEFVSLTSSTNFSSATTLMSAMAQPPPMTTVNATTGSVTALATQNGTSAQKTEQVSTVMPNMISQELHPEENMILILENMTWIEALSYCRRHHFDLVHITTKYMQDTIAEMARNATSPYVWLGLRYTCEFDFWFWTRSTSSCYQNWLPGQGPERDYDCGVSGAIEATGRQQWVGLPESEKLNFICSACAG